MEAAAPVATPPVIPAVNGSINRIEHSPLASRVAWDQERIDLVKRVVCPKEITNDEFALFMQQCRRTELDPLIREAFCVPRKKNVGTKQAEKWITVHEFQPAHDGMLARADRFPDYRGIRAAAVYEKDQFEIVEKDGAVTVTHAFKPNQPRGALIGAWAQVFREGRTSSPEWLLFGEYLDSRNSKWTHSPQTMIVKCARYAALRRAYPNVFGGLYGEDELGDDDGAPTAPIQVAGSRTDQVLEKLQTRTAAPAVTIDAKPTTPAPAASPPKVSPKPTKGILTFGPAAVKGRAIGDLTGEEITAAIDLGTSKLKEPGNAAANWRDDVERVLVELRAELEDRKAALLAPPPAAPPPPMREPGDDSEEAPL